MADTLTTHFGLVQPQVGGSQNTWGTKLNADFSNLDSYLWNLATISCTASTTANVVTLTPLNGFSVGSTLNNFQKFDFIADASASGVVTVKAGALLAKKLFLPDGVTQATTGNILIGVYYVIAYNTALDSAAGGFVISSNSNVIGGIINPQHGGTGVANNAANTQTFSGNFGITWTLSGTTELTLPASGTVATHSDKLSAFASTTSAELASVISNETGTGVLVFSDSPALTGTPTAPTQSPGDNSTKIATTAYVDAAVTSITKFSSSVAYAGSFSATVSHGLGRTPDIFNLCFENTSSEGNYTPGDIILWPPSTYSGGAGGGTSASNVYANSTNVGVTGSVLEFADKSTGLPFTPSSGKWNYLFTAAIF